MNKDMVKSPAHYTEGRKFEPKDVIRDWGLNFNMGNAVKYIARAGRKDDILQDLKKAIHYLEFEVEAIEYWQKENKQAVPTQPKCKCSINPVFAEMENGKGVCVGVLEIAVPAGADPEDIIKAVIKEVYGGE